MIHVENLTKLYHIPSGIIRAVDGITFSIPSGSILGLLGPNGAGKTTTIKIICTLLEPTSGTVSVGGFDVTKKPLDVRKQLGVVFGQRMIYHRLSGRANLEYYGKLYGVNNLDRRIDELAEFFEIKGRVDDLVETYSTGMRAKLSLMRAMIHDPQVLLLDEPTLGLDPGIAIKLRRKINELKKANRTILLSTHYLHEAEDLCDDIAILYKGKIIAHDNPKRLQQKHSKNKQLVIYYGVNPAIDAYLGKNKVRIIKDASGTYAVISISHMDEVALWQKIFAGYKSNIHNFSISEPTLEDLYIAATKGKSA